MSSGGPLDFFSDPVVIEIYTDGSCIGGPNDRRGGWAARVHEPGREPTTLSGGEPGPTTNNRMELVAAIRALEWLDSQGRLATFPIFVFTDSEYLAKNVPFIPVWKQRGWMTMGSEYRGSEPVANRDLWEHIDRLCAKSQEVTFRAIPRASNSENVLCDRLAREAAEAGKAGAV